MSLRILISMVLLCVPVPMLLAAAVKPTQKAVEALAAPRFVRPIAGAQVVTGKVTNEKLVVRVKVFDGEGKLIEKRDVLPDGEDQTFLAGFRSPLTAGWVVMASLVNGGKEVVTSAPVVVAASSVLAVAEGTAKAPTATGTPGVSAGAVGAMANSGTPASPPKAESPAAKEEKKWGACEVGTTESGLATPAIRAGSGATELSGLAVLNSGKVTVCVNRQPSNIASTSANPKTFGTEGVPFHNGTYSVALRDKLLPNQDVLVIVTSEDGKKRISGNAAVKVAEIKGTPVRVSSAVMAGSDTVDVTATATPSGGSYEVRISTCPGVSAKLKTSDSKPYVVSGESGNVVVTFEAPFYEGQEIGLCQMAFDKGSNEPLPIVFPEPEKSASTTASAQSTHSAKAAAANAKSLTASNGTGGTLSMVPAENVIRVVDNGDLGRFRYYFTSGIVLSNSRGFATQAGGTQAGGFLGLTADRAWFPGDDRGWRKWNFNTFFDARLTQVATQQSSETPNTGSLQSFSQSAKAASLQGGVYLPFLSEPWEAGPHKELYSLFIGPLAKTGFVTLTESANVNAIPNTPAQVQQVTGRFFTNYSYGTRLGVFRHRKNRDAAPELVHWVDISLGRFGGFEAFRDARLQRPDLYPPNALSDGNPQFITQRLWRWQFEGLLKVPHTPFVVGFNANVGRGAASPFVLDGKEYHFAQPRDDLRFLIGAQFDFAKLMRALPRLE